MAESINPGLIPRHIWLKNRVKHVISEMKTLESIEEWEKYRIMALELSKELNYAVLEWGRYYPPKCEHEPKGTCYLSDPPVYECKKCGERYFTCT